METLSKLEIARFKEDGFLTVQNVFSREEISRFRKKILQIIDKGNSPDVTDVMFLNYSSILMNKDFLVYPELREIMLDDRILTIVKSILGPSPVYFGFSKMFVNYEKRCLPAHRDNYNPIEDWADDYSLLRIGLYLQDHSRNGGGLWVNAQSHKGIKKGKIMPTCVTGKEGSVAVWDFRSKHSVSSFSPHLLKGLKVPTFLELMYHRLYKLFISTNRKKLKKPRIFLHLLFAKDDLHLKRVVTKLSGEKKDGFWLKEQMRNTSYDQETLNYFENKGVTLVNLPDIINKKQVKSF